MQNTSSKLHLSRTNPLRSNLSRLSVLIGLTVPVMLGAKGGCGKDYVSLGSEAGEGGDSSSAGSGGRAPGTGGRPIAGSPTYGGGPASGGSNVGGSADAGAGPSSGGSANAGSGATPGGAGEGSGGDGGAPACGVVPRPLTLAECNALGAVASSKANPDGCDYGQPSLGPLLGVDGQFCCRPVAQVSPEQCSTGGGNLVGDPGDGSTVRYGCPAGQRFFGSVLFDDDPSLPVGEGSICCEPPLPVISDAQCAARGGEPIGDFMSNPDLYRYGCPGGRRALGSVAFEEGGLCCEIPEHITIAECTARCGQPIGDPGDGSTRREGCPDRRRWIATLGVELGDEGGICCALP